MKMCVCALICAIALVMPAAAQGADIVGTWTVNAMLDSGALPPSTLTLNREGTKIVGTLSGEQGDMRVEASLKEKAVTIWFTVPTQNGPTAITMTGTVDGDAIKGEADLGGGNKATWTATRNAGAPSPVATQSDSRVDVTGTWAMAVETAAGSGTPTIVLKQDGEALTGHYSGQLGEAELTGSARGSAVEFGFNVSVEGTSIHVTYSGTAAATSMKGTVKLGDLGDGTFTGKKK
jgi:hypothetical protein